MGVDDGCWAKVLAIRPEHRAARGARCTQDALSGVVKAGAVFGRLQAFLVWLRRSNEEGLDLTIRLEERLHVHNQVFFQGQALDGLDVNRLGDVEVLDERLARKAVTTVDAHRIRATNTVSAAATEAQRAINFPLYFVKTIEDSVGGEHLDVIVFPVGLGVALGVKPTNNKRHCERGHLRHYSRSVSNSGSH